MNENKIKSYQFGPFRLETQWQRLFRGETIIPLTRKRYEILLLLVENAGKVLHKDDIISNIWQNQVVEESNLTQHVYVLRRLIEDDPRTPKYILTIPGEGYQFHPLVKVTSGIPTPIDSEVETHQVTQDDITPELSSDQSAAIETRLPGFNGALERLKGWSLLISPLKVGALSVGILALVAVLVLLVSRRNEKKQAINPVISPLLTIPGIKSSLTYSADGKFLAFISDAENANSPDVYVKIASSGDPVRITNSVAGEFFVAWSPDGRELAFLRWSPERPEAYQLIVAPALGGMEREVAQVEGGLSWSPDGRYFAVTNSDQPDSATGIFLLSVDGQSRQALSVPENRRLFDSTPRFSPDGTKVAFVRWVNSTSGDLHIVNVSNRETRQITFDQRRINDLQWSPDGRLLFFTSNRNGNQRLWQIAADGGNPELVNTVPVDILNFTISPLNNGRQYLAYSQKINDTTTEVYQLGISNNNATGSGSTSICTINSSRTDDSPRWSPNGQQIAFISNRSGFDEIWIASSNCTQPTQLTSLKTNDVGSPRWSPDGRMITFDQVLQGQAEIMRVEVSTGKILRMTADMGDDLLPAWSADGQWLYFTSDRSGRSQIWRMASEGGSTTQITQNGGFEPVESPDGKTLYYTRSNYLWQKDLISGEESQVKEIANIPVRRYWHIGSKHIYYTPQNSPGQRAVFKLNLATRAISKVNDLGGFASRFVPGISVTAGEEMLVGSYVGYRFSDIQVVENWR
jgi:Tol biopolymer transport system component/DNA-binding winged helix-turn-helix (wHTH) protein